MKNIASICMLSALLWTSCSTEKTSKNKAPEESTTTDTYTNPVLAGDYPDPSILVDDEDYYMVHSSFEYYPGLLIWHSRDLINWKPVVNSLHTYVGSVWAPELVKYEGTYYIYFPANDKNYVISAPSIEGPWSTPVELEIEGIDPGHVVDEEGSRYLYFNNGSYAPLTKDGLSKAGELKHVYDGWLIPREWTIECMCMEGPKIVKRGEYYYLTTAEGGTAGPATSHMVIQARSKSPLGPWENAPHNPIIRTEDPSERWWSLGHGTVFEDKNGDWWMFFHGYENGHYNMGRQTLLVPIEWTEDGWYKIPDDIDINKPIQRPEGEVIRPLFSLSDDFSGNQLSPHWKFFKEYDTTRFKVADNSLTIKGKGNSISTSSPLLTIPADHAYTADVELEIEGNSKGGLTLFYKEQFASGILADSTSILADLRGWQFPTEKNVINRHVFLRMKNVNHHVDMYYSLDGKEWIKIENSLEVSGFHHNVLSGFMSLRLGLVSIGEGSVTFKNFVYTPINQ